MPTEKRGPRTLELAKRPYSFGGKSADGDGKVKEPLAGKGATLRLATPDGDTREWKLIADTGRPVSCIIRPNDLPDFSFGAGTHVSTNFGLLEAA